MLEIERKFILSKIPNPLPKLEIKQGYLQTDKDRTVRIRAVTNLKGIIKTFRPCLKFSESKISKILAIQSTVHP